MFAEQCDTSCTEQFGVYFLLYEEQFGIFFVTSVSSTFYHVPDAPVIRANFDFDVF